MATRYCGTLGIITATRAPRSRPSDCSQAPSACDSSSTSRKLIRAVHAGQRVARGMALEGGFEQVGQAA